MCSLTGEVSFGADKISLPWTAEKKKQKNKNKRQAFRRLRRKESKTMKTLTQINPMTLTQKTRLWLVAVAALLGTSLIPISTRAGDCGNIRGTWNSTDPETAGDIVGILIPDEEAYAVTKVGEDGSVHYIGKHVWITAHGTLYAEFKGVLSPINELEYNVNEQNIITGGTGEYEGVSGSYRIQGIWDDTNFVGSGVYHGRLCLQD
jgi:hypothetical protein